MLTGTKDDESSSRRLLTAARLCMRSVHVCCWQILLRNSSSEHFGYIAEKYLGRRR